MYKLSAVECYAANTKVLMQVILLKS